MRGLFLGCHNVFYTDWIHRQKLGIVFPEVRISKCQRISSSMVLSLWAALQEGRAALACRAEVCPIMEAFSAWLWLLDAVYVVLLQEALFPVLYLAKTAVLWVASVLSLEQREYCNTCQELNFIFKSCFLQNWISVTLPVYSRPTHGNWCRGMTWASFSNRYIFNNYSQGVVLPFVRSYKLSNASLWLLSLFLFLWLWTSFVTVVDCFMKEGVFCCFTLKCLVPLRYHWDGLIQTWIRKVGLMTHIKTTNTFALWPQEKHSLILCFRLSLTIRGESILERQGREMIQQVKHWRYLHKGRLRSTNGTITLLSHQSSTFSLNFLVAKMPWFLGDESTGDGGNDLEVNGWDLQISRRQGKLTHQVWERRICFSSCSTGILI